MSDSIAAAPAEAAGGWHQPTSPTSGLAGYDLEELKDLDHHQLAEHGKAIITPLTKKVTPDRRHRCEVHDDADRAARDTAVPTDSQKASGNYRKGRLRYQGLKIAIETPRGSERSGVGADGTPWAVKMPAHYGYVEATHGADGDCVDCFLGPHLHDGPVYVVDQLDAETGEFDEHKCLLGYPGEHHAIADYDAAFDDGRGPQRRGAVTTMSLQEFREWLRRGDTRKPLAFSPTHDTPSLGKARKEGTMSYRLRKEDMPPEDEEEFAEEEAPEGEEEYAEEPAEGEEFPEDEGEEVAAQPGAQPPQAPQAPQPPMDPAAAGAPAAGPDQAMAQGGPIESTLPTMLDALGGSIMSIMGAPPPQRRELLARSLEEFAMALAAEMDNQVEKAFYAGANAEVRKMVRGNLRKSLGEAGAMSMVVQHAQDFADEFRGSPESTAAVDAWTDMGTQVVRMLVDEAAPMEAMAEPGPTAEEEVLERAAAIKNLVKMQRARLNKANRPKMRKSEATVSDVSGQSGSVDGEVSAEDSMQPDEWRADDVIANEGDVAKSDNPFADEEDDDTEDDAEGEPAIGEEEMTKMQRRMRKSEEATVGPVSGQSGEVEGDVNAEDNMQPEEYRADEVIANEGEVAKTVLAEMKKMQRAFASSMEKMAGQLAKANGEINRLKSQPVPAKGALRSVEKGQDIGGLSKGMNLEAEAERLEKMSPDDRAQALIKHAFSNPRRIM